MVETLRALPQGAVRDALQTLIHDLASFALEPRCMEMQADGVPCESAKAQCDRCQHVARVLDHLRAEVPH